MPEPAVQVEHLWKKFRKGELHDSLRELLPAVGRRLIGRGLQRGELGTREFWALADVSFEIPPGQSLGIIGPNGAGKSTMLKVLSRVLKPNRGSYRVHGRLSSLIEIGAGFHGDLTGRENIYLNGIILGMTRQQIHAREDQIIDFSGIEEFIDTPIKRYSSGMLARLGFSVAAHMDPEILLVDEVLSVGDALFRDKCIRHMHGLLRSGITVIFISHILDQVRALCPQTLVLDHGRAAFHGPTDLAIRRYLDILSTGAPAAAASDGSPVRIGNVRFVKEDGSPTLEWEVRRPGGVEFDVTVARPTGRLAVLANFSSVGGVYITTANSEVDGSPLPGRVGTQRVRFLLDPVPFAEGDFTVAFQVHDVDAQWRCLWSSAQPLAVTVRGAAPPGPLIRCHGRWTAVAAAPAAAGPQPAAAGDAG